MEKIDLTENFIRLLNQYQNLVFSICLKLTGDYFAAEDLTQETFLSAYQHLEEFDGQAEKAWLCRIASNKSIDYLRAAGRREKPASELEGQPEDSSPAGFWMENGQNGMEQTENEPLKQVINHEILEELKEACEALKSPYREVALSYFLEEKTTTEIAKASGTGIHTVKTQLRRAREQLKKSLGKEWLK